MKNTKVTIKFALLIVPLVLMSIWVLALLFTNSKVTDQTLIVFCVVAVFDGIYGLFLARNINATLKIITDKIEKQAADLSGYSGYIAETVEVLQNMTKGKMWVALKQDFDGEFEILKLSLFKFSDTINAALSDILNTASQVDNGANTLASTSQTLAQGASEQASSIEELSASIAEVSERTKQNARDAEKAKELSAATEKIAQSSAADMELVRQAMEEISVASRDISKVIKAIDDIAFQTNILALNAAVEAARAGSSGKGFAVVADEVRNLSQKSAEAARSTTALIESSIGAVAKGSGLVNNTSMSFAEVADKSAEVSRIVDTIFKQAQEQAAAISQLSTGVDQISTVVQTNSATAEENAAYSEELSGQAESLKNTVLHFELF